MEIMRVENLTKVYGKGENEVTVALAGFPSTEYAAHTMVNHMWDYGYQRFEMGYASAIAAILFLLMFVCRKLINLLLERVGR